MIGQRDALRLSGRMVLDPMGRRVGMVGQLFLDDRTEQPAWITVESGVFGTKMRLVPLRGATFDGATLIVAVPRSTVWRAPRVALHQGDLPAEAEEQLRLYYGCGGPHRMTVGSGEPSEPSQPGKKAGRRDALPGPPTEYSTHGTGSFGGGKAGPIGSITNRLKGIIRKLVM